MNNKFELSIVLPAYLEEENLNIILPRIFSTVKKFETNLEVLVIDTEVPLDCTENVCKKYDANYINRIGDNTYGSALRIGINKARGKYVLLMDADGSHSPEFISKLYEKRDENCVVIASRYTEGGSTYNNRYLVWMSKILNLIYSITLRLNIKDVSNSFRLYDRSLLNNLGLQCNNFDIVEEIIYKIMRHNNNVIIKEIPYSFKKRMFGQTKRNTFAFVFSFLITLLRLISSDLKFDVMLKHLYNPKCKD